MKPHSVTALLVVLAGCSVGPKTWTPNTDRTDLAITEWYGSGDDHCGGILYQAESAPRSWCPGLASGPNPKGFLCLTSEAEAKRYVEKACGK
jgi:hypothetical protein